MKYVPNNVSVREEMLRDIGVGSTEELFKAIPEPLRLREELKISAPTNELKLTRSLRALAAQQAKNGISFMGAGSYRRFIPSAIGAITSRAEFLTSYTPYQPEVSQGSLQVMFEFQTLLAQLTGMDIANGSMYEGASATAEAIMMAKRISPKGTKVFISEGLHPEYLETVRTYLHHQGLEIVIIPLTAEGRTDLHRLEAELDTSALCSVLQIVNFMGVIEDQQAHAALLASSKTLNIAVLPEMTALGLIAPPGYFGADIVVGEGQSLGLPPSYGGPALGIFAASQKYMRQMPGRLSGQTVDAEGKRAFCLTLSTREQHIRREKATSNICSNQALCALAVSVYLSLLGKKGLKDLAQLNFNKAHYAFQELTSIEGLRARYNGPFYNEFVLELPIPAASIVTQAELRGIYPGVALSNFNPKDFNGLLVNVTEVNTKEEIDQLKITLEELCR